VNKILQGLREAYDSVRCAHDMEYLRDVERDGVQGRCRICRVTFTSWAGGRHYHELVLARDFPKPSVSR